MTSKAGSSPNNEPTMASIQQQINSLEGMDVGKDYHKIVKQIGKDLDNIRSCGSNGQQEIQKIKASLQELKQKVTPSSSLKDLTVGRIQNFVKKGTLRTTSERILKKLDSEISRCDQIYKHLGSNTDLISKVREDIKEAFRSDLSRIRTASDEGFINAAMSYFDSAFNHVKFTESKHYEELGGQLRTAISEIAGKQTSLEHKTNLLRKVTIAAAEYASTKNLPALQKAINEITR